MNMQLLRYNRENRRGAAFLTVMIVVTIAAMVSTSAMVLAMNQPLIISRVKNHIVAKAIAEAGINEAYSRLASDFSLRNTPSAFTETQYGGGSYAVEVVPVGNTRAQLISSGTYRGQAARVAMDICNIGEESQGNPESCPWGQTIFANGTITLNGSGTAFGRVHANVRVNQHGSVDWGLPDRSCDVSAVQSITVRGASTIYGTLKAPSVVTSENSVITQVLQTSVPIIPMPEMDLTEMYNTAVANGQVYPGGNYNSNVTLANIPGGVAWFNGNVNFKKNIDFNGCVIATGNITFNGAMQAGRAGNLPLIISRDGSIRINGHHTLRGLIYSKGDIRLNGSGIIEGTMIAGGDITLNGSYGIITYESCIPPGHESEGSGEDIIVVSAWQE
jgi:hypothetical protein